MTPGTRPGLRELLPSVGAVLGVPQTQDTIGLQAALGGRCSTVVVLLVDGLGAHNLAGHLDLAPNLAAGQDLGGLLSPIPSTTAAAVTSFGTGLPVGQHGILGSAFEVDGAPLWPLSWGATPYPLATQPEPTMFQRFESAGVAVCSAAPARFRLSGLTQAALRGGEYPGADSAAERVAIVADRVAQAAGSGWASLVYVYWPELDKAGHEYGVDSRQWRVELGVVDSLVADLAAVLLPGACLLVTADHGMIDVPDAARFDLDRRATLRRGVRRILGEPRLRHVYCEPGQAAGTLRRWRTELAGVAEVLDRDEAAARWFAPLDPWYADRVGDVVALATGGHCLVSDRVDQVVSNLRGQHGAGSPTEREVPLLAWIT